MTRSSWEEIAQFFQIFPSLIIPSKKKINKEKQYKNNWIKASR